MAERVTTFGGGPVKDRRVRAMTARFGGQDGEVRGHDIRDAQVVFQWLRAAKARYRLGRVVTHVCHHDEGVGNCTDSVTEA